MKKTIFLLFILSYSFLSLFVDSSFAFQSENIGMKKVSLILKKVIVVDSDTLGESMKERNALIEEVTRSLPNILITWNLKPTLDTTLLYKLELQKYKLSCEISALKTVFTRYGISMTEDSIFEKLPKASYVYSDGIWGDPDREFVGYITGSQMKKTGYGIYAPPLFEFIKNNWSGEIYDTGSLRSGLYDEHILLSAILKKLESGSSIILWGDWCTDERYEDGVFEKNHKKIMRFFPLGGKNTCVRSQDDRVMKWKTPAGKEIAGVSGEHTFILLGYIGTRENPSHIIVWDTDTGRHIYPTDEWLRKWRLLSYRNLIIHGLLNPF